MTINAGVWIDYHKAVVVLVCDEKETMFQIMSDRDIPARYPGGARWKKSSTRNDFSAEDKREHGVVVYLNKYYDEVIGRLRDADSILILGPGEAKNELKIRIQGKKHPGQITRVETVDNMTEGEIGAQVRKLFSTGSQQGLTRITK